MKRDDRRRHHRKLRVLLGHLMDRGVGALNRELHQVFDVSAVDLMTKRLVEHFDGSLRSDFTGFGAADAISYRKDRALADRARKESSFSGRRSFSPRSESGCGLNLEGFRRLRSLHRLQLKGRRTLCHRPIRYDTSRAFRFENAINIPNIAKLVIKLKPPWLTNGSVIPVIGKARRIPPIFTNA